MADFALGDFIAQFNPDAGLCAPAATPVSDEERLNRRAQIAAFETFLTNLPIGDQFPLQDNTFHHFCGPLYIREMRLPKGHVVVGAIHKSETLSFLLQGQIRVMTENGLADFSAPRMIMSPPGTKRVGSAMEDVVWVTVHAIGDERDIETIEGMLAAPSFEEFERLQAATPLEIAA